MKISVVMDSYRNININGLIKLPMTYERIGIFKPNKALPEDLVVGLVFNREVSA